MKNKNTDKERYKFYFDEHTLFIELNDILHADTIMEIYNEIKEGFPNKEIKVVAYKNILGYWAAYVIENGRSIYCGTMSGKTTKEQINKYLENENMCNK